MTLQRLTGIAALIALFGIFSAWGAEGTGNRGVLMRKAPPQKTPPPPEPAPRKEKPAPERTTTPPPPPASDKPPAPRPGAITPIPAAPLPTATAPTAANWPEGLNDFFHSSLTNPTTDEVLGTLVRHLNRRTLTAYTPEEEYERVQEWLKSFRKNLSRREDNLDLVLGYYRNLTSWVALESQYNLEQNRDLLKDLVRVVQSQAELDPSFDDERRQKIVNTIEQQGLFVPSTILFGYSVLPFRAVILPKGFVPYESPAKPEFTDTTQRAIASYDFIEAPGPIFRIDLDTIGAARIGVEQSADNAKFQLVQEWKAKQSSGAQGPLVLSKLFRSRYMRVTVESAKEVAVLRNPRVFALKEPAAVVSPPVQTAPELDGSFKEASWPRKAQVDGFINTELTSFAEAQTTVRVCHTSDALFIAVYAREPRMSTMASSMTARDASLWDEESIAIVLRPVGKPEYRFVVNPLGAQFDSRDGDDSWDGDWNVVTKTWPVGWSAEISIPFAALDALPDDDWEIDFVRTRRNVTNERSTWVDAVASQNEKGLLIFE